MKKILLATSLFAASTVNAAGYDFDNMSVAAELTNSTYDAPGSFESATGFSAAVDIPYINEGSDLKSSLEIGYASLGDSNGTSSGIDMTLSASSFFVASKFYYDINDKVAAYAKLGFNVLSVSAEASANGFTASADESSSKLLYGFGASYNATKEVSVQAGYTAYASDTTALSAGVQLKF